MDDLLESVKDLVEITFPEKDDFLKIRETLSRIGVASRKEKELFQSCHILHKRGKYYIVHFKELFKLDGKQTNFDESDVARRNTIVDLLRQWNLVKVLDSKKIEDLDFALTPPENNNLLGNFFFIIFAQCKTIVSC